MEVLNKLVQVYQHLPSWLIAALAYLSTWLGDGKELMLYIFIVVVADTICGIWRSKKQGIGLKSEGLRSMISKLVIYFIMMIVTITLDKTGCFDSIIITRACTAIIIGAEAISILGSLAIIYPSLGAISLLRKLLYSEMADKLNTDKEEIEKIIEHGTK